MWDSLRLDDGSASDSVPVRVAGVIRSAIQRDHIPSGGRLPSSRQLAATLGVSRQSVVEAMDLLAGEGWISIIPRSGPIVAVDPVVVRERDEHARASSERDDGRVRIRPGGTALTAGIATAWRRALRHHAGQTEEGDPLGSTALRAAIADHVHRTRGVPLDPGRLIVTSGLVDSLCAVCLGAGLSGRTIAIEDPGYPTARETLRALGCALSGVPVDDDGLVVERLDDHAAAVLTTPSHQFPMGGRLPVSRRQALLSWAEEHDVVVLEDDYDGEFRYGSPPLPALASLDHERAVYLGTLSKVLNQGIRIAFVHLPERITADVQALRGALGCPVPTVLQHAVTDLFESGALSRHVTRVRRLYSVRRAALIAGLRPITGIRAISGLEAGLHLTLLLEPDTSAAGVIGRLASLGVETADLDEFRLRPNPRAPGLILAYGHLDDGEIESVIHAVAAALAEAREVARASGDRGVPVVPWRNGPMPVPP